MFESRAPLFSTQSPGFPRLLGDIGGTNARLAWQPRANAEIEHVMVLPCADHPSLVHAIETYLQAQDLPRPAWAAIGMANPVTGDSVTMTNHTWSFSVSDLRQALGVSRLVLLNDFTALALALPSLPIEAKKLIDPYGTTHVLKETAIGLIGPGTGLGVSGLIPQQGRWWPISGEGGHVTLSATNELEFEVIRCLEKRYGHVSAERVLSGPGLVDLFHVLSKINGETADEMTHAAQVMASANEGRVNTATKTLDLFCAFLGCTAGNLALTLGAQGGIYLGGGILPRMLDRLEKSEFRDRFEAKGRFKTYLQSIPVWVIDSPVSPALQGANEALNS
jgi:glucokinase